MPEEKLSRLKQLIQVTSSVLLSLIGNLQYASSVVKPGRTFQRRTIDLIHNGKFIWTVTYN